MHEKYYYTKIIKELTLSVAMVSEVKLKTCGGSFLRIC